MNSKSGNGTGEHERLEATEQEQPYERDPFDYSPEVKAMLAQQRSDYDLLPRRFEQMRSEINELNALMRGTVFPAVARIDRRLADIERHDINSTRELHARIDSLTSAIDKLAQVILESRT